MTLRSSAHSDGAPRAAVRHPFSVALAGVAMALAMCAFPLLPAHAEAPCLLSCQTTAPAPTAPATPSPTATKTEQPVPANPPAPAPPAPAVPAPAPSPTASVEAEPTATPSETPTVSSSATPSASPTTSSASPSASSNWDTPIQDGLKATQAAAVSGTKGPGSDMFAVIAIMGGVLLVAAGGIAFALWSRGRFSSH